MNQLTEEKTCRECGTAIFGRTDKKFCSDACRNTYNNKSNADTTNYIRNVNNILRRNRRILLELNPEDKAKVKFEKLLHKGFNLEYHTNAYRTKSGQEYRYCYDQGYLSLNDDFVLIVKRKEF